MDINPLTINRIDQCTPPSRKMPKRLGLGGNPGAVLVFFLWHPDHTDGACRIRFVFSTTYEDDGFSADHQKTSRFGTRSGSAAFAGTDAGTAHIRYV
jgi:hypothetical protein